MRNTSAQILARRWGAYAQPKTKEERVISALERAFPGSQWIEDQPLPASTAPTSNGPTRDGGTIPREDSEGGAGAVLRRRLSMLSVLDQALAYGQHGDPGKTPPEAPAQVYDYAFIGSSKIDGPKLEKWVASLHPDATVVVCEPRWRKDGALMNSEAFIVDLFGRVESPELHKDLFGDKARDAQVEAVCNSAKTIVLAGTGSRVTLAKNWAKRFGPRFRPNIIEIGAS